jgi:NAD-dependent deacetylase
VALTGAGISVESGIPDFRSKGGLWTRFPPEEYATLQAFRRDPEKVWRMFAEMSQVLDAARPNPAHEALFELERLGVLEGIVTQNIDGLHQRAGSERVVEFHGSILTLTCLGCGERYERGEASLGMPPRCGCGKLLKPDVVLFGEHIPPHAVEESRRLVEHCRVLLVVGTSAEVTPASFLPVQAKRRGAVVVEINVAPTLLTHGVTDIFLEGKAGVVLPTLAEEIKKLLAG